MAGKDRKPTQPGQRRGQGAGTQVREWVGGRLTAPVYISEPKPFRPEIILWLELPDDLIVGHALIDPSSPPASFGETLLQASASPLAGPPRRPKRIRVAQEHLGAELRVAFPDIEVVVAPTPELDQVIAQMVASMPAGGGNAPSYLERGRLAPQTLDAMFPAAEALFRSAPWNELDDSAGLRLDIPALGVEGACVSVIGALGESLGLVIFPSHLARELFLTSVETSEERDTSLDMGTTILSLDFDRGADLPAGMRREVADHGWPVAGPTAYPRVTHRDRDGVPRPIEERDVRIVTACAQGVAAFVGKHREQIRQASPTVMEARHVGADGIETRVTLPYEAGASPAADPKTAARPPAAVPKEAANQDPAALHHIDGRLVEAILEQGGRRFGKALARAAKAGSLRHAPVAFVAPFLAFHVLFNGKPLAHWFGQEHASRLSNTELAWLKAQQAAWLSVWEVLAVEPGRGLRLRDLLTGEVRDVLESGASQTLIARYGILARVVDYEGLSLLCGTHPRPLPPREAAEVVGRAPESLRRAGTDAMSRLREEKMGRDLIGRWDAVVAELDRRPVGLPKLTNTEGHDLLLTVDHFGYAPALEAEIGGCLAAMDGVEAPPGDASEQSYFFDDIGGVSRPDGARTMLARATLGKGKLRVETNSVERADRYRKLIETACGDRIRHRTREHSDPLALLEKYRGAAPPVPDPAGPSADELNAIALDFKRRHYADWSNRPLPALGGQTPRAAVRTKTGRAQVDLLLKEAEMAESRGPKGQAFDFSILRRELGLLD